MKKYKVELLPEEIIEGGYYVNNNHLSITNKRIILYGYRPYKFIQDLDYKHIVSIKFVEINYLWRLILAIPLLLTGIIFTMGNKNQNDLINLIGIIIIGLAIILIITAFVKETYLQIFTTDHKVNWKLHTKHAEEIMLMIRKRSL